MDAAAVRRSVRFALQLLISGGILAFLVFRIDVSRTIDLIASSDAVYLVGALAIFLVTTWLMAWRWQVLLASKGIDEPLGWLTKLYFVGYAAGQVLPTSVGGDAVRIVEHARRRPRAKGEAAAAVLMERMLGSMGVVILVAVGLAVAAGRSRNLEAFIWIELACVAAIAVAAVLLFSRRTGRELQDRVFPLGRRLRLDRPLQSVYAALQGYRSRPGVLALMFAVTLVTQVARLFAIWFCGEAVGIDVSPIVYFILGPLLYLVMLVPFTINGLGVREAFFVAFLAGFGVEADAALATGFLYFAVTVATSLPGALVLASASVRSALSGGAGRRAPPETDVS